MTSIPKLPLPSRDTTTAAPLASDADLLTPRFLALLESELPTSTQPPHKLGERDLAATHREERGAILLSRMSGGRLSGLSASATELAFAAGGHWE